MKAIELIIISVIIFTANGAPIQNTTSPYAGYEEDILFIIKLLCPSTNVVYLDDNSSGSTISADEPLVDFELSEVSKQSLRDTYCPEIRENKNYDPANQQMISSERTTSSPFLMSTTTTTTTTITSKTVLSYEDSLLCIIKYLCPNVHIIHLNDNDSEDSTSFDQFELSFELQELLRQKFQDPQNCPQFLSDNKETETMAIEYSPPISEDSTTTSSITNYFSTSKEKVPNYENDILFIIKLICPSTKMIYLSDDGSEYTVPDLENIELDENLMKKIQKSSCPEALRINIETVSKADKYLTTTLSESSTFASMETIGSSTSVTNSEMYTSTISSSTDANNKNDVSIIIKLLCPKIQIMYLNSDGSESTNHTEIDDSLKQKLQELHCPKLSSNNTTVADTTPTPTIAAISTSTTIEVPSTTSTTDDAYTASTTDDADTTSTATDVPSTTNTTDVPSTTSETVVSYTTSTITDIPSTTSTTDIPSTTSIAIVSSTANTANKIVANFNDELLLKLLCSNIQILRSSIKDSDGSMTISQKQLDSKLKEENEKLNCSQVLSYYQENNINYESAISTSTSVAPAVTSEMTNPSTNSTIDDSTSMSSTDDSTTMSSTDDSTIMSSTVKPSTTSAIAVDITTTSTTFIPITTSTQFEPTTVSTTFEPITLSTTVDSTFTSTSPNYKGLLLMIKLLCPNTKIVYLNNNDLEFSTKINEMDLDSEINDELKQKIQESHCPRPSYKEDQMETNEYSTTASTKWTTTTSTTTAVPTTTVVDYITSTTIVTKTDSNAVSSTIDTTATPCVNSPVTPVIPCYTESFECLLTKLLGKAKDYINEKIQSVKKCPQA